MQAEELDPSEWGLDRIVDMAYDKRSFRDLTVTIRTVSNSGFHECRFPEEPRPLRDANKLVSKLPVQLVYVQHPLSVGLLVVIASHTGENLRLEDLVKGTRDLYQSIYEVEDLSSDIFLQSYGEIEGMPAAHVNNRVCTDWVFGIYLYFLIQLTLADLYVFKGYNIVSPRVHN